MERPTRVYLVRHGETEWNSLGQFQGHQDVALSEKGRRQAECARERFSGENIAAFYASDLRRALETAVIIAGPHGKPVEPVPELREMDFGCWEGLTFEQIAGRYPTELVAWFRGPGTVGVPGGESFAQVQERAWAALRRIATRHPGERVLVVSHGGTIRALLCAALNLSSDAVWRLRLDNAAISTIDFYSDGPVVSLVNDCSHLRGLHKVAGSKS
ncbi:MAG: alpha-ribazole phosphatase [Moorellales bacterium]